jgi:rod shape-determining protein MreC
MQSIHKNKRKKNIFIYIVVIIIIFIVNPFHIFDSFRNVIMAPLAPILHSSFNKGTYIAERVDMLIHMRTLYSENQLLKHDIQQFRAHESFDADIANENKMLREELNLLPRDEVHLMGAEVILRDPLGGNQWVMINRGKNDGVNIGDGVIVGDSIFIGAIDELTDNTARVKLITHPDNSVNIVTARSSSEAIAYGEHGLSVVVEDIKKDDDVVDGDMFVTSSIGNTFPRGFNVGTIQGIKFSQDNLFKKGTIVPLIELSDLNFVFVIK